MNNSFHREQQIKQDEAKRKAAADGHQTLETYQLEKQRFADGQIPNADEFDVGPYKPGLLARIRRIFGGK
ncbi:hypothetical protein FBR02_12390 [Anaerolineae bacterium CFX9]|nr:hypothetical protein [Anaerolineae bacterium CFX9]